MFSIKNLSAYQRINVPTYQHINVSTSIASRGVSVGLVAASHLDVGLDGSPFVGLLAAVHGLLGAAGAEGGAAHGHDGGHKQQRHSFFCSVFHCYLLFFNNITRRCIFFTHRKGTKDF